jgi:hypothetical protein
MEIRISHWCEFLLNYWQTATVFDFCVASSLIVIGGWLVSRSTSR